MQLVLQVQTGKACACLGLSSGQRAVVDGGGAWSSSLGYLHTCVGGPSTWKEEQAMGWMSVSPLARGQ